ncbi:MAG: helix-turn-helix domain-containing protein [Tissierellia bacterium]|nr:helix-turn-helix domain-containing protein [Tissierellia bacterium]
MAQTKNKGGAKGKYHDWIEPEGLLKIEGWARDGLTDEQIANNMGVHRDTLVQWKKKYPDISDTLKKGKEVVGRAVENALLKRALGYSYIETTEELNRETGAMEVTKRVTKEVVPDTTAQIFWLKNRKPEDWRDRKETHLSGEVRSNPFDELSPSELRKLIASE